ncbi:MAG: hypothetical protein H6702_01095 [Myxococcales bacterium]|nr:hypothetical protein [Myxococcales bacterium]
MSATAWDGGPLPEGEALRAALLDDAQRPRLVRAGVVDPHVAQAADAWVQPLLFDPDPRARAVGLQVAHAGGSRMHARPVAQALVERAQAFVGVPDPLHPGQTLGQSALRYLVAVPGPGHSAARAGLAAALAHAELRLEAWRALADEDPAVLLPHVGDLLAQAPELAEPVGTRFALVHTAHVEAACLAVAGLPEVTRRAFGQAVEKHLKRIFQVKRWVACRRILLGK